jgi:hypothetical protein
MSARTKRVTIENRESQKYKRAIMMMGEIKCSVGAF